MENDSNDVEEISLCSDSSVFPFKGKLRPAEKFKINLVNEIKIKADSKLIKTQPLVYNKKPTLENRENSLRMENLDLNNSIPDTLNDENEPELRIRNPLEVLDRNDINILDGFNKNEILFKKIPFEVRKDIGMKYKEYCNEFDETYFRKKITGRCNNFRNYGRDNYSSRK
jgi:hypothetical protein